MLSAVHWLLFAIFVSLTVASACYGLHMYLLIVLTRANADRTCRAQDEQISAYQSDTPDERWPRVTTQLPIYNELTVARRIIEAVAELDYPRDRHEIQVLDDSTDETREIVDAAAARLAARGVDIKIVRRSDRRDYKAGALAHGLRAARGEFIAIFDADFIPERGFLRRMIPLIAPHADVACVQGRWGHINEQDSWVTRAFAVGMDGHFALEQTGRAWSGLLMNFNGTAGIWRRAAIDDPRVGGWSGDTITEDLDLSYRVQLAGWRMEYRRDEVVPQEIPADVNALKVQQRRWATGSIQTACKLLPRLWGSSQTLARKLEGTFHLTQYSINVVMLLVALLARWLVALTPESIIRPYLDATSLLLVVVAIAPTVAYAFARWSVGASIPGPVRIAQLIVLGCGLSLNNTVAVLAGLAQRGGEFIRTPKTGASDAAAAPAGAEPLSRRSPYQALRSRLWALELLTGAWCLFQWGWFLQADRYVGGVFLLLLGIGFLTMGWASRPTFARTAARRRPSISVPPGVATPRESVVRTARVPLMKATPRLRAQRDAEIASFVESGAGR